MQIAIQPIKATVVSTTNAEFLNVTIAYDDLFTWASFRYSLLDTDGNEQVSGCERVDGTDYTTWDGNNEFPIDFVISKHSEIVRI